MKKGIIMEINDGYLTLLTPEGEFLRARKVQEDYRLGEEINFFPESASIQRKNSIFTILDSFKAKTVALSAAVLLLLAAFLPVYQDGEVYAYMTIDVNPSIELGVNEDIKVLSIKGYNQDGKKIAARISNWEKKDAAVVADMVLEEIEEEGYLDEKKEIVLTTVPAGEKQVKADKKLEEKVSEIRKESVNDRLELKVMHGTAEERKKAKEQGLTTGQYKEKMSETKKQEKPSGQKDEKKQDKETAAKQEHGKPAREEPKGQLKKPAKEKPQVNKVVPQKPPANQNQNKDHGLKGNRNENRQNGQGKENSNRQVHENKEGKGGQPQFTQRPKQDKGKQHQDNRDAVPGQEKKDNGKGPKK